MALPDRPVANTTIDSEWGQAVHDWTFAPKGVRAHGGAAISIDDASDQLLNLDVADDDPGGWLDAANDRLEVPTDADGLYLVVAEFAASGGAVNSETRGTVYVNGAKAFSALEQNEAAVSSAWTAVGIIDLSAGDLITCTARLRHDSGANPTVYVIHMSVVRIGFEIGA